MFKHLLVPLDGSRLAETVLPAAAYLARLLGAQVTLLHLVEHNAPRTVHSESHLTDAAAAERYLADLAARAFPPGTPVDWHVHTAEITAVAESIVAHAEEWGVDLIVLATHGRSGLEIRLVGSIAQQVIALGRRPVLVIRPEIGPAGIAREVPASPWLLVPLDGQPAHEQSLPVAAALAQAGRGRVHLVGCIPTPGTLQGSEAATSRLLPQSTRALLDLAGEEAERYLQARVADLRARGVEATAELCRGDAVDTLVTAAERLGASAVVMATHGKAGLDAFWSGSLTPRLLARSRLPLLLIPVNE